jgi:glycosyltransferase involved in cell wall biosynthesis
MRVLLSAYACEPNRGSEPEVGWQRALHMLPFADEVWVLTRSNNQAVIEADPLSHAPGLHFIYYDLPRWALKLKKQAWFLRVYFILWQWGAYRLAAKRHYDKPFDIVYHVTFVSMLYGSFMGRLGIPFVIGPIAGGERAPLRLRRGIPLRGKAREMLRDLSILFHRYYPLARQAYASAKRIYVTTSDSLRLIPPKWRSKVAVRLAVATISHATHIDAWRPPDDPRFVFAGNFLYFKGIHLAIRALAEARKTIPYATLTLLGVGPDESWLRSVARRYGVAHAVEFAGRLPRQQLVGSLPRYTALVFPSLHDSGGMVILEALSVGLPVICLDFGGPGVIVNESCGIVVSTADAGEAQTVTGIANAMVSLGAMSSMEFERLSMGAAARANELTWTRLAAYIAACEN